MKIYESWANASRNAGQAVVIKGCSRPNTGGVIIRVGDKLIDGSVRHRLQTLSKELV